MSLFDCGPRSRTGDVLTASDANSRAARAEPIGVIADTLEAERCLCQKPVLLFSRLFFRDCELYLTSPSRHGCFATEVNHICFWGGSGLLQLQNFFSAIFILELTRAALLVGPYVDALYYCSFPNRRVVDFVSLIWLSLPTL